MEVSRNEKALEIPRRLIPLEHVGWTILSFLNPIGAFLNLVPKAPMAEAPTRVERDVPVEDSEISPDTNTTVTAEVRKFVEFYEDLQDLRQQMGLISNKTADQTALTLRLDALMDNSTQTREFVVHLLSTAAGTSPVVNFLFVWLLIMTVGSVILGGMVLYEVIPQYLEKIQGSITRLKGPSTKGKDMKQDLTCAI